MSDLINNPWPSTVKAERHGSDGIRLENKEGSIVVFVVPVLRPYVEVDTEALAKQVMTVDDGLTKKLRNYLDAYGKAFNSVVIREWVLGRRPNTRVKRGVLEWRPGISEVEKVGKNVDPGASDAFENWHGDSLSYVRFDTMGDEAAVVLHMEGPTKAEVWVGNVEEFFRLQSLDLGYGEDLAELNLMFDNMILWASWMIGGFEDPEMIESIWIELIRQDPDILFPQLVDDLLPNVPIGLDQAFDKWLRRRKFGSENAVGQKYLWSNISEERDL